MKDFLKRSFDIIASFFGLIMLSPVLLLIALLIKLNGSGPVLFRQERTGRFGKPFIMYKYRTMIVNHGGNTVSIKGDSRITPLGAVLRKHKLDELPELWNVLIGDMSLVGPRPDMPELTDKLMGDERIILDLRPGITGPATIKYSNEEELLASIQDPKKYNDEVVWRDKVRINLDYYRTRNLMGDLMIIIRTLLRR